MKAVFASLGLAAALAGNLALPGTARADDDDDVVVRGAAAPEVETTTSLPNRSLLRSGVFTLAASYVPALVVAIESDREADDHLYAPVVGPWLDLAERDDEGDRETLNKVLLVTDGVFQGLGALQILGSFIFPETRAVTVSNSDGTPAVTFTVTPAKLASGNGIVAIGEC